MWKDSLNPEKNCAQKKGLLYQDLNRSDFEYIESGYLSLVDIQYINRKKR
jgi:hypothetical protein